MPKNLVSRDGFSRPVPRQPAHLHTQAESDAYLRDSSRVPWRRPFMKPPYAIGSVQSLSSHAIAYQWRSLPRVRRHRASKPQGSYERVLPWQVTMDQFICASLSHTHYWYEVGMLKLHHNRSPRWFLLTLGRGFESRCRHTNWDFFSQKKKMPNKWRTIKSLEQKIRLHGRRGEGTPESFSREKLRQAPQKEGGEILCGLPPV